jgi:UDP-N-acetyl-D-glucosamine/UDP-N-acetyl-D-galactosamine dehydrogenase
MLTLEDVKEVDAIVLTVAHNEFKAIGLDDLSKLYSDNKRILIDVKSIKNKKEAISKGYYIEVYSTNVKEVGELEK